MLLHALLQYLLSFSVDPGTDGHHHGKDDQIPQAANAMAEHRGHDHEDAATQSQDRKHEPPPHILILLLAHPLNQNGQVHQINGNNGQFGRIEHKGSGPGTGQIGQIEIAQPNAE